MLLIEIIHVKIVLESIKDKVNFFFGWGLFAGQVTIIIIIATASTTLIFYRLYLLRRGGSRVVLKVC